MQARDRTGWFSGPDPATEDDEGEEDDMITLIDTERGEHWVAANGKARPLADPARWMSGWKGPVRESPTMKSVIEDLYELTSSRADSSAVETHIDAAE